MVDMNPALLDSESAACADSAILMLKLADMLTPSLATDASPMLIVTVPSAGRLTESLPCADSEIVALSDALPVAESTPAHVSFRVKP
jgi:hypothetical protein